MNCKVPVTDVTKEMKKKMEKLKKKDKTMSYNNQVRKGLELLFEKYGI